MQELSLHILDLMENSTRAGATIVAVSVVEDAATDRIEITVEDNGPGLTVSNETAMDPFFTTKKNKKTGLGISFLRAAAEQAGGGVTLARSALGGLAVKAVMQLSHVDRMPMGDLAGTIAAVVCTNPEIDVRCALRARGNTFAVSTQDVARGLDPAERTGLALSDLVARKITAALAAMPVTA